MLASMVVHVRNSCRVIVIGTGLATSFFVIVSAVTSLQVQVFHPFRIGSGSLVRAQGRCFDGRHKQTETLALPTSSTGTVIVAAWLCNGAVRTIVVIAIEVTIRFITSISGCQPFFVPLPTFFRSCLWTKKERRTDRLVR